MWLQVCEMITVYKYVVYSKNIMFLKYILFAHRNDYNCIQMLLSGKTEVASPEKLSGHNHPRFLILGYDRIPAPDSSIIIIIIIIISAH